MVDIFAPSVDVCAFSGAIPVVPRLVDFNTVVAAVTVAEAADTVGSVVGLSTVDDVATSMNVVLASSVVDTGTDTRPVDVIGVIFVDIGGPAVDSSSVDDAE
ncbi:hypothetical protein GDO81_003239 [Engystomops pustulosus]|uniref:Uncharacterized protein n=1 Tax=Engystomops pustulosus TaxID=76066 RepID=A0AAV7A293_ENGPU|nr:hypothetical protein GDO81_003239 [Engystomops pustulosus]